jgi:hypothetical protein
MAEPIKPTQNGFFKGTESFEPVNVGKAGGDQNPKFLWPSNQYQVYNGRELVNKTLVRGYIRSLIGNKDGFSTALKGTNRPTENTSVPVSTNGRLNFQFNPELIVRDVSRSDGAINPLLTDPMNLTQPVPGTATFNFSMTFNREAEVAMGVALRTKTFLTKSEEDNAAAHIQGVMADIAVLDSIIGQGISKKTIDILLKYTQQTITTRNNAAAGDNDEKTVEVNQLTADQEKTVLTNLTDNLGNQAFLNPMPVRIVFSQFLMVEGFVTSTAVAFQKFSPDMIPTIAQVNCTVQALYFGFAKEKAFLTDNLKNFGKAEVGDTPNLTIVENKAASDAMNSLNLVGKVYVNYFADVAQTIGEKVTDEEKFYDGRINLKSWRSPSDDDMRVAQGNYGTAEEYPNGATNTTANFHMVYNILYTQCFKGANDQTLLDKNTLIGLLNHSPNTTATEGIMPVLVEFNPVDFNILSKNNLTEIKFEVALLLDWSNSNTKKSKKDISVSTIDLNQYSAGMDGNKTSNATDRKYFTQCFLEFNKVNAAIKPDLLNYNPASQNLSSTFDRKYVTEYDTFILKCKVTPYILVGSNKKAIGRSKVGTIPYKWEFNTSNYLYYFGVNTTKELKWT